MQLFLLKPKSEPLVEGLNQASGNTHCSLAKKDKGPCSLGQCVCLCVKFSRQLLSLNSPRVKQTRFLWRCNRICTNILSAVNLGVSEWKQS